LLAGRKPLAGPVNLPTPLSAARKPSAFRLTGALRSGQRRLLGDPQGRNGAAGNSRRRIIMSQPAHKLRYGVLQVTIWRNTGDKGMFYSVIPSRSYKKGDDAWDQTDSLGFDDLLTMAKLLDEAHSWIAVQQKADAKARKEAAAAEA
jgi:hypothetical protein